MRYAMLAALLSGVAVSPVSAQSTSPDADAVAAACGGEVQHDEFAKLPKSVQFEKLSCFTREAAVRFNRSLPNKVDEATTLERVKANGVTLSYVYSVNMLASDLGPGVLEAFKPSVIEKVCTAADMRSIIAVGGRYEYLWFDKNGDAIGSLMVDHCA